MDTLLPVATAAIVAVAVLAFVDPAHAADDAPKHADRVTIGDTARPEPRVARTRTTPLARLPLSPHAPASEFATIKAKSFGTAAPASGPPSLAQLEKRAAAASAPSSAHPEASGLKPREISTIAPPTAGVPAPPIDDRMRTKSRSLVAAPSVGRISAGHHNGALGLIPRPEWAATGTSAKPTGTSAKPEEARTIGTTSTAPEPAAPSAVELQRRAAPTAPAPGVTKGPAGSTSRPRDPSAPPARADKWRSARPTAQEVRP